MKEKVKILVMFLVALLIVSTATGQIITVDDDGPADFNNIQDAINYSWHGDIIVVQPGHHNTFYFNNRAVTVTSIDPNDPNVVDATVIAGTVAFDFLEDSNSILTGFRIITSPPPDDFGSIECWGTSPTITKNICYGIVGFYVAFPTITYNTIHEGNGSVIFDCDGIISHNRISGAIQDCDGTISNNIIQHSRGHGLVNCDGTIIGNIIADNDDGGLKLCDGDIINNEIRDNGDNEGSYAEYGGGLYQCNANIIGNTIFNNKAHRNGGGLYECNGNIENNIIKENRLLSQGYATYGGALSMCNGSISNNTISENSADYCGGLHECQGSITYNVIADNSSGGSGGGLSGCDGDIVSNIIVNNHSGYYGGGLYLCSGDIKNNIITNNYAQEFGGGLFDCDGNIIRNTISHNYAVRGGGGLKNCQGIISNLITGNYAGQQGGGLHYCYNIINNTIVGNNAGEIGGAIYQCNTNIKNNIIAFNVAYVGGIYGSCQNNYNAFWSNGINFGDGAYARTGDIYTNPLFAVDGYWDSNDNWVEGDYHLKSETGRWEPNSESWLQDNVTSLCIDAGDPSSDWTGELWPHGKRINIGVYGRTPHASMSLSDAGNIADLNNDGFVDFTDLLLDKWLCEDVLLPEDLNRDGIFNFADFAIFAYNCKSPPLPPLSGQASNPNPADGATGVDINADLSWTTGSYVTSHDVYFGTSSPPPFVCNQTATIFDPGTMDRGTTYYWCIDEVNKWGKTIGQLWRFTTLEGTPPPPPSPP